jgi:hypothetical protein
MLLAWQKRPTFSLSVNKFLVGRLYEVIEVKEKIFLCMQLAPGGELFTRLTQQGQSPLFFQT